MKFNEINTDFETSLDDIKETSLMTKEQVNNLKFAMTVAVAGKLNLLTWGACNNGKTSILQNVSQILPQLDETESKEVTEIYSSVGLLKPTEKYKINRPVRMPHYTATINGMRGVSSHTDESKFRLGEVSLAHNGILFLDEASEFKTSVLQMLNVPTNKHSILLSKGNETVECKTDFQLFMTMQPCPCGNYGSSKTCLCSQKSIEQYWTKVTAPLFAKLPDTTTIRFDCNSYLSLEELMTVEKMRELITNAWDMQKKRARFNGRAANPSYDFITVKINDDIERYAFLYLNYLIKTNKERWQVYYIARTLADMRKDEIISREDFRLAKKLRGEPFLEGEFFLGSLERNEKIIGGKINLLNQVLIEGKIADNYEVINENQIEFPITYVRRYRDNGKVKKEINYFIIECNDRLAEKIKEIEPSNFIGRNVRITGTLKQSKENGVNFKIVVECIEFKPFSS